MEQTTTAAIHHDQNVGGGRKEIFRVNIILSVLTIIELAFGFSMYYIHNAPVTIHFIKGIIIILMLAKAFYIVGYFMHLKHELRNMIMTVVVPLLLFVWFILAFLADGNSFNNLKNRYNGYYKEHMSQPMPQKEEHKEEPKKKDAMD